MKKTGTVSVGRVNLVWVNIRMNPTRAMWLLTFQFGTTPAASVFKTYLNIVFVEITSIITGFLIATFSTELVSGYYTTIIQ